MARPRKNVTCEALRAAYIDRGLSTTEIALASKSILGVQVTPATVYNFLVRFNIPLRSKSVSVSAAKTRTPAIRLTDVTGKGKKDGAHWNVRYWNARWLVATGKIKVEKSTLTIDQASKLKEMLDQLGENNAVPEGLVEEAFKEARIAGFPYITYDKPHAEEAWHRLIKCDPKKNGHSYHWVGAETTLATMFHPHIYECRKKGRLTPIELFNSDEDLKRAIRKAYCLHGRITPRILNDICRNEDASGRVGNFPPRVGKAVIKELWPNTAGLRVLDPCAGFSGRMFSCAISDKVDKYFGIDLSEKTFDGLKKSADFISSMGCLMKIEVRNADCVSELQRVDEEFDMVMTSPPFFNVEEYVGVPLPQSYKTWVNEFLEPMIRLSSARLRDGGKMALYIEDVAPHDIQTECIRIASLSGMRNDRPVHFVMNYGTSRRLSVGKGINILCWTKERR